MIRIQIRQFILDFGCPNLTQFLVRCQFCGFFHIKERYLTILILLTFCNWCGSDRIRICQTASYVWVGFANLNCAGCNGSQCCGSRSAGSVLFPWIRIRIKSREWFRIRIKIRAGSGSNYMDPDLAKSSKKKK